MTQGRIIAVRGWIVRPPIGRPAWLCTLYMWKGGMVLKAKSLVFILAGIIVLASVVTTEAQSARKWGVGTFIAFNSPMGKLGDQFGPSTKLGLNWQYLLSERLYFELEYHHSDWDKGKLVDKTFNWGVTGADILSPNATQTMKMNSVSANLLIFHQEIPSFRAKDFAYYVQVGAGFYNYRAERTNFIFPGQATEPLNTALVLQPQVDTRAALTTHFGLGVQAFAIDNIAVDIRARYHVMMGDIRPMWDWGVENKVFPMMLFDVGAGIKFYFWK